MPFLTEADTCRRYVLPKLYAANWTGDKISEQKSFTDGRIVVAGSKVKRRRQKRADYLLRYGRTASEIWPPLFGEIEGAGRSDLARTRSDVCERLCRALRTNWTSNCHTVCPPLGWGPTIFRPESSAPVRAFLCQRCSLSCC
jgi:hypothetical protein